MAELFNQIVGLLGNPRSRIESNLKELVREIGEEPIIEQASQRYHFYDFPRSGFTLDFSSEHNMFTAATFFVSAGSTNLAHSHSRQFFSGHLPYGVKRTDSRTVVEKKCPGGTMAVKDYRYDVDLRPLVMQFCFDASSANLLLISVDYLA